MIITMTLIIIIIVIIIISIIIILVSIIIIMISISIMIISITISTIKNTANMNIKKVEEVLQSTPYIEAKVISLCVFFAIPLFCKGSYKLRELGGPQKEGKMIENR